MRSADGDSAIGVVAPQRQGWRRLWFIGAIVVVLVAGVLTTLNLSEQERATRASVPTPIAEESRPDAIPLLRPTLPRTPISAAWTPPGGWMKAPGGISYVVGPGLSQFGELPELPIGLPAEPPWPRTALSELPLDAPLAIPLAVAFQSIENPGTPNEVLQPVLLGGGRPVTVDTIRLSLPNGTDTFFPPAGSQSVSSTGTRVVFAQHREVLVFDLTTRRTTRIPVPDDAIADAGWSTTDPEAVVVRSATTTWLVRTDTGVVTPAPPRAAASRWTITTSHGSHPRVLLESHEAGSPAIVSLDATWLGAPPSLWSDAGLAREPVAVGNHIAFATAPDWNSHGLIGTDVAKVVVLDISAGTARRPAVRAALLPDNVAVDVVGWDPSGRRVLFVAGAGSGKYLLAWDPGGGGFYRVTHDIGWPALGPAYPHQ